MKKLTVVIIAITIAASLPVLQSCQSTKTATSSKLLKFNFEKGKGYDYEMTMNMDQDVMGQNMKMDMSTYYSMDVKEDDGNEKTITTTFDRIKIGMDMGPMKMDVDSDKPLPIDNSGDSSINNAMSKVNRLFTALKGKQFSMKVNAEGKVTEVTGFKEMAQSIVSSFGDEMSAEEKEKMLKQFDQQFSDEGMKGQMERVLYIFPNKEVKVGDTWQKSSTSVGQMPATYNSTYTVKEIEGDMVTLDEKSTIKSTDDKMETTGTVDGTIVVDSRSGLVVTATQNMNMTVKAGGMSMGMKGITKVKGKAR